MLKYWTFIFHIHPPITDSGTRTRDHTIKSRALYQLSYASDLHTPHVAFLVRHHSLSNVYYHKTLLTELPLTKARFELAKHTHVILSDAPLTARELCLLHHHSTNYIAGLL
jgi:hypothetical protein